MNRGECELLLRGGIVIDGTGNRRRTADVAVTGDRISAVGRLDRRMRPAREVDASGLVVSPGFIDTHTHDDRAVLSDPGMACKVSQGVTTVVSGNCGVSLAPLTGREPPPPLNLLGGEEWYRFPTFAAYREELEGAPPALNVAMQVGHTSLRACVMDRFDRPATRDEIERMEELADEAMRAGCIGFSTGLAYPPARAAPAEEVIAIARRAATFGGMHSTHMRDEEAGVLDSVRETIRIGREAGVAVVISHHKCAGRDNWGGTRETLALIAEAQAAAQAIDLDVYPYVAGSTVLLAEIVARSEKVLVSWSEPHPEAAGRPLDEIARAWGCGLPEAVDRLQPAGGIYFMMAEDDLARIIEFPGAMIGSDGLPHDVFPHPRLWGTFPRVLGRYCREEGLIGLEEAVHRMTGKPAAVFGLAGRGEVREGAFADLVIFDPDTIIDEATFEDPIRPAAGIRAVFVNGREVWANGSAVPPAAAGPRPGRMLRRTPPAASA